MRPAKLMAAVVGVLILLGSAAFVTAGAVTLAVTDGDGWIEAGPVRITSASTALVGDDIDVDLGDAVDERTWIGIGEVPARIDVATRNGKDVFVGIAPASTVDRYLAGIAHDRVDIFGNRAADLRRTGGATALEDPAAQEFWVESSTTGTLEWDITDGEWAVVVLNADGSPGVDVAVTGAARIPFARGIAAVLIVAGVLGLAGGATLTYFGVRRGPKPPAPVPPATPAEPVAVG